MSNTRKPVSTNRARQIRAAIAMVNTERYGGATPVEAEALERVQVGDHVRVARYATLYKRRELEKSRTRQIQVIAQQEIVDSAKAEASSIQNQWESQRRFS